MKSAEIRQKFLDYFAEHGHTPVASSSLVPHQDPTLLFTNAGMVPFKDIFTGQAPSAYRRATSAQRCVRAGGKHNDLDNVGYTARHHTFFEMLGNFSFGDYFKREAIQFAWELLTGVFQLPPEKLWITVFEDDDEAAGIWLNEMGVDPARFSRCGEADNFWAMGDTGPCGPCSEIFYDHGPSIAGGPPGSPEADGDRYVEIWNLVFMQYEQAPDGSRSLLPAPSVDTGMGLERISAVLQGVHSNYDTDLFVPLIQRAAALTACQDLQHNALKVIADHIRASAFLLADGVLPGNEGRGYVLRRIIRRACRHGHDLGMTDPFFHALVPTLVSLMGVAYPELAEKAEFIQTALEQEELQFQKTLAHGVKELQAVFANLSGQCIPGEIVFKLYDTYGFPADLTADVAREQGFSIDMPGFEQAMAAQRARSQAANQFASDYLPPQVLQQATQFSGYDQLSLDTRVAHAIVDGVSVAAIEPGATALVILPQTPFYAEGGGQVGDKGLITQGEAVFEVHDTQKQGAVFVHHGVQRRGQLQVGQAAHAQVTTDERVATMQHHSATHLLHAALREVLGTHVEQRGSLVNPDKLRFDFAHQAPLQAEQLASIEQLVNRQIQRNLTVQVEQLSMDAAKARGAIMLFDEKYGDTVRVLTMGDFSCELCGGTHVRQTAEIGAFKIIAETGVAAGIRRIEAVAGQAALAWYAAGEAVLQQAAQLLKGQRLTVHEKVAQLLGQQRSLEKRVADLERRLLAGATQAGSSLPVQEVAGVSVITAQFEGIDVKALREQLDNYKSRYERAVIVLASVSDARVQLVAGVTKPCIEQLHAGHLVHHVAIQIGGKGGGRADMAQAGGTDSSALPAALAGVADWVSAEMKKG